MNLVYRMIGKRFFDVTTSAITLFVSAPFLMIVVFFIKTTSPGPVLFVQERLGRAKRPFRLVKFRTMTDAAREPVSEILPGHADVTVVGRFIRRLKIDELPQLWNVLVGDMSLVGPRPDISRDTAIADQRYHSRFVVRPGLTGMAQVHGNIYLSWPQRWEYDAMYVDRVSLKMDLWLIWRTFRVIVVGEKRCLVPSPEEARCKRH